MALLHFLNSLFAPVPVSNDNPMPASIVGATGTALPTGVGVPTDSLRVVLASGGVKVTVAPTVSSSPAYVAGDCVGSLMTFANLAPGNDLGFYVAKIKVACKSAQTAPLDMLLFSTNPSNTTFTDNSALALNAADYDALSGVVHLVDWTNLGTPSLLQGFPNLPAFPASGTATLYGQLIARSGFTLGSTSDLSVSLTSEPS